MQRLRFVLPINQGDLFITKIYLTIAGLAASCETLLYSEMSAISTIPIILNGDGLSNNNTLTWTIAQTNSTKTGNTTDQQPITYKFFVPHNVLLVTWRVNILNACMDCPFMTFHVLARGLPSPQNFIQTAAIFPNKSGDTSMDFYPQQNAWHYIDIGFQLAVSDSTPEPMIFTQNVNTDSKRMNDTDSQLPPVSYTVDFSIELSYSYDTKDNATGDNSSVNFANIQTATDMSNMVDEEDTEGVPASQQNIQYYTLLRHTYREFFMFDYDLMPDENGTVPSFINLTAGIPAGFRFEVGDVYDIGGTLSFAVAIRDIVKEYPVHIKGGAIVAEKLVDSSGAADANNNLVVTDAVTTTIEKDTSAGSSSRSLSRSNQTIIICMRLNEPGIPTWPDKCTYGRHILPAASIINNTNEDTRTGLIHIPFPEAGLWHVTLGLFCHGSETSARITIIDSVKEFIKRHVNVLDDVQGPCACLNRSAYYRQCIVEPMCLSKMNESETLKVKECMLDSKCTNKFQEMIHRFDVHHKYAIEQSVETDSSCNTSVVFTISSSPCVAGRCGRYGRCYHYMSGGFVFSTCLCIKGYRGWDCTEDTQVPSSFSILIGLLLLTTSNLLFIPSIYFAIRRKYHTEGIIYFFAMFFSIFYHACDSGEDEYSFCLVKIGVLQFCDFYCGLLAIWVTLIAMAHVRQSFISLLHMCGAILLAFGTELNKQALWVFLAPALTGLCIISVSWGYRCHHTRKWFPSRRYLSIFLPTGMILVMVGLVCYAFLQTRQNYHIVHSIWHMVMALSILCLLPSRQSFLPKS